VEDKKIRTYDELFKALAEGTGKPPEHFKKSLDNAGPSKITPKCLDVEEVEILPKLTNRLRAEHIAECDFCSFLIQESVDGELIQEMGQKMHPIEFGHYHCTGAIQGNWILDRKA